MSLNHQGSRKVCLRATIYSDFTSSKSKGYYRRWQQIGGKKLKTTLAKAQQKVYCDTLREEEWQGKLTNNKWEDSVLESGVCFAWMNSWRLVPPHTVVAMQELYQQMLPTKFYHQRKTGKGSGTSNVTCGICGELPESVPHVLVGCRALAQTKWGYRSGELICMWILRIELVQDSINVST